MRYIFLASFLAISTVYAQNTFTSSPDLVYGQLFKDVQMRKIYRDSKTFADCVPLKDPATILSSYQQIKNNPAVRFSLRGFLGENFSEPPMVVDHSSQREEDLNTYLKESLQKLATKSSDVNKNNSLISLPYPYIVPGGRFQEMHYKDSYFIMLGLQMGSNYDMIENMVQNIAYLLQQYDYIPAGNRTYYLSRSAPPYFACMLDLLAEKKGTVVYALYQTALLKEYEYWMDKSKVQVKHTVTMPDGTVLNRYCDALSTPRPEAYYEDSTASAYLFSSKRKNFYRNLRSAAESGWGNSSRWLTNPDSISSIQTTDIVPIDLNCLLYHLEITLSKSYKTTGNLLQSNYYEKLAQKRKQAINKYFFNDKVGWYYDYNATRGSIGKQLTIAGMMPFFLNVAPSDAINKAVKVLQENFIKKGGVATTFVKTGNHWDAPNGIPCMQWITVKGLDNYNEKTLAKSIASKWIATVQQTFKESGRLFEIYNVEIPGNEPFVADYPIQEGFGTTNGVLLKLMGY